MANVQVRTGGQTCRELGTKGPVPAGRVDVWPDGREAMSVVLALGAEGVRSRPTGIRGR